MANQIFKVPTDGQEFMVEVNWSRWNYSGDIKVNGKVVKAWQKAKWVPKKVEFEVGNQKAEIRRGGWLVEKYTLVVNDKKYEAI